MHVILAALYGGEVTNTKFRNIFFSGIYFLQKNTIMQFSSKMKIRKKIGTEAGKFFEHYNLDKFRQKYDQKKPYRLSIFSQFSMQIFFYFLLFLVFHLSAANTFFGKIAGIKEKFFVPAFIKNTFTQTENAPN